MNVVNLMEQLKAPEQEKLEKTLVLRFTTEKIVEHNIYTMKRFKDWIFKRVQNITSDQWLFVLGS